MAVSRAEDRKKVVLAMDLCALLYEEDTKFWWSAIPKIVEFYQGGKGA